MELNSEQLFGSIVRNFNVYPHQADAIQWMRTILYNIGNPNIMGGGILGDDMGFGKTLEVAATIAATPVPSTLILCPPSTRYEWINHLLKCVKGVTIYTIEGDKFYKCFISINEEGGEEPDQRPLDKKRGEEFIEPAILVCNYQLISAGLKNNKMVTEKIWYNIFVDEGHFLRNTNDTWNKLNALKQPMVNINGMQHRLGSRWVISGTPLQMGPQDLFNIFRFIDNRFMRSGNENELRMFIGTNLFRRNRNQLTRFMKQFMKYPDSDPIFYDRRISLETTSLSEHISRLSYEQIIALCKDNREALNAILSDEKAFLIAKTSESKAYNMRSSIGSFTESEEFKIMISYPYGSVPIFINQLYPQENFVYKGRKSKVDEFKMIVNSHPNESFIVFHHYDNIAIEIERVLASEFHSYTILKINGKVTSDKERYNIVQRANRLIAKNVPVILISSIKATSEGLNYQSFSNVITFDPEYNQKTEEQAKARVQRIGQLNQVKIFEITIDDFVGYYGTISVDRKTQNIRDERKHLSDIIDQFNAAFTWRRHRFTNEDGVRESGIYFGDQFESQTRGSIGGPDSYGPLYIN